MANALSRQVRIVDLHEREARVFPREELFGLNGQSLLLPETRELSAVDLRDVASGVELRALGLIGHLPLTSQITLNLRPKFPIPNLWEMLSLADEAYDRVLPVLRSYATSNLSAPHQLLARGFCQYLRQILSTGLTRGYYQKPYRGHFKPKVNFGRTVSGFLSRGDDVNVAAEVVEFSSDLYTNGLLKSAALAFLQLVPRQESWQADRRLLLEALNALQNVTPQRMRVGEQFLANSLPMWVRDSYLGALTIHSILLGYTKIGFGFDAQGCNMPSFLFSLDSIFESYVRNIMRAALKSHDISVLDGNLFRHQLPLFRDNTKFPVKPDLIFRHKKIVLGLGEVKYKPKIDEVDRYQLISHVVATGAPFGVWVSPAVNESGLEYVGSITSGARFYHYRLNINGNLALNSALMITAIKDLLTAM